MERFRTVAFWRSLGAHVLLGAVILLINFPKTVEEFVTNDIPNEWWQGVLLAPLRFVQGIVGSLVGDDPPGVLSTFLTLEFLMLWALVLLALFIAIRRRDLHYLGLAMLGLGLGYWSVHLLSWLAVIIVTVVGVTFSIVAWFLGILGAVLWFIVKFGWPLALIAVSGFLIHRFRDQLFKVIAGLGAVGLALFVLYKVVPIIWNWLVVLLTPLFKVIGFIIMVLAATMAVVATAVLGMLALALLGSLIVSQFTAAYFADRGRKGILLATFAVGSALTLVMLVSIASPQASEAVNHAFNASVGAAHSQSQFATVLFANTLPEAVKIFVFDNLTAATPPVVDATILMFAMSVTLMSLARGLAVNAKDADDTSIVYFGLKEYAGIIGGILVGLVLIFGSAFLESDTA